jgi:hypothetical protein
MKRVLALLPVLLAFQVGVSPALAWTWPVDGPVLRPFAFAPDSPYAGGQHRGIDIGAPTGTPVLAPAAGTVSFAGTVPGGGLTLALRTADGYSVTLVHLGAIGVARGATVEEGGVVGSVGPSGEPELPEPSVHLGIRIAADPQGYVDPLSFLPARSGAPPIDASSSVEGASVRPAAGLTEPAPDAPASGTAVDNGVAAARPPAPASRSGGTRHVRERSHAVRRPATEWTRTAAQMPLEKRLVAPDHPLPLLVSSETSAAAEKPPDALSRVLPALVLVGAIAGATGLALRRRLRAARATHRAAAVSSEPREACPDLDRVATQPNSSTSVPVVRDRRSACADVAREAVPVPIVVARSPSRLGRSCDCATHPAANPARRNHEGASV